MSHSLCKGPDSEVVVYAVLLGTKGWCLGGVKLGLVKGSYGVVLHAGYLFDSAGGWCLGGVGLDWVKDT